MRKLLLLLMVVRHGSVATAQIGSESEPPDAAGVLCRPTGTFLTLAMPGAWAPGQRGATTAELRAALATQDFGLCLESNAWPSEVSPVAGLRIELREAARIVIEVRDAVTDKYVRRELDLTGVPVDAQPLTLAIAADELTRASWAELLLEDAPEPARPPPPAVQAVVERQAEHVIQERQEESDRLPWWFDLTFAVDHYGGGDTHLGGQASVERWLHRRVALRLGIGGRVGLSVDGAQARVQARALPASLYLMFGIVGDPQAGLHLVVGGGAQMRWVRYVSTSMSGARTANPSAATLVTSAEVSARWSLGIVRLVVGLRLGGVLFGARAVESGSGLTGVSGFEVAAHAGIGVRL